MRQLVAQKLGGLLGPLVLAFLYLVPLALWAAPAPLDTRFVGRFQTLTSIALLLAYAGVSAFALNLVLGARLRAVEALFGGLERMYRAHRVNGELAFALLLGHVVLDPRRAARRSRPRLRSTCSAPERAGRSSPA